ncbi:nucleoid occlusion protein [Microaerobacter geothermalis]|uniref:nucleoid occlusion protein n=1 Tax=Microaerobacter geothermalis TaxID=674972 RepID=UPI001F2ED29C|nr:nucleoid occlusion protein [Microaerobacter geothermalis]MCF6095103.1 nucleoid occlusion protein [Microaerobacter geothermalis]
MRDHFSRIFGLAEKQEADVIRQIPVDQIIPNPFQPRSVFNDKKIEELCHTIKTHGIIQPIIVRQRENQFEIIAGERRWRAVKKLGLETIPAIVRDFNDTQSASIALIENLQREELTAIEEAIAYQQLIDLHQLTQESLAQRLGKGQSTIANKLRLLQLPSSIQEALRNRLITERHARAMLSIKDEDTQLQLLKEIIEKELNVKQTEARIEQLLNKNRKEKRPTRISFSKDVRLAINTVRQSVDMILKNGLTIETEEEDMDEYYQFTIKIPKKK